MAKSKCLDSVSQWEREQVSQYPELKVFIDKLIDIIEKKPGGGRPDPLLSETGINLPCKKHSVNISLFSPQYAIGYKFITASYLYNGSDIVIVKMSFS